MQKTAQIRDYLTLCKPRVVLLMLVTAWIGMFLASPKITPWHALLFGTLGIASAASAAAIINHLMDRHIDSHMLRTQARPIASGRVSPTNAIIFAICLVLFAAVILSSLVNIITTILTFATFFGYAFIYTMYLKRATPQNIVIGGLSGAMPPLLGWTAVTGSIGYYGILLVLIIFIWTPPHFWSLAIYRTNDYAAAKIPMLPVTHGKNFTKLNIVLYTFLLLAVSCLPFVVGFAGIIYFVSAIILGSIFIAYALRLYFSSTINEHKRAIKSFNFSIVYLILLFSALLLDNKSGIY